MIKSHGHSLIPAVWVILTNDKDEYFCYDVLILDGKMGPLQYLQDT
jgi:hypothetical protein